MSRILTIIATAAACLMLTACASKTTMTTAEADGWSHYGAVGQSQGTEVALGALEGGETDIVIEGTIESVCETKGCWMQAVDGNDAVFVRFQDYSFFVPMNAAGQTFVAHGRAEADVVSVEELQHYAGDAGKSAAEIALITETEDRITFYADSIYISGDDLDAPHKQ